MTLFLRFQYVLWAVLAIAPLVVSESIQSEEKTSSEPFSIPFEPDPPGVEVATRAEVVAMVPTDKLVVFSFDCEGCYGEFPVGDEEATYTPWAIGAEHIYAGNTVPATFKSRIDAKQLGVGSDGTMKFIAEAGSSINQNKIQGWIISGNSDDPLVFRIGTTSTNNDMGYRYISGSGTVIAPDGTKVELGR